MTIPLHDLVDHCVNDQARRWRQGERVPIETFIATHPELASDDPRMDLVYAEVLLRESSGEEVRETEYLARFPDLQERIASLFQLHARFSPPARVEPARVSESDAPLRTTRFAEYTLVGRGGAGTVYRARDLDLDRTVAIKILHQYAAELGGAERLRKEASAIARLQHPNIVRIHDVGEEGGQPYLVLEYVAGGTLADWLKNGVLPVRDALVLVRDIARALQTAHDKGIIHRDLKPGNILLQQGPEDSTTCLPMIADFGLARRLDENTMTQSGAMVGTAFYMAPEQAECAAVGPTADVYSLGAILFECLTGRPPFLGDTPLATLMLAAKSDPVLPSRLRPGISRDLDAVVLQCLQHDPSRRYPSAGTLADDLDRVLTDRSTQARPATLLDRGRKWTRRNPQIAALAAAAFIIAGLGLGGVLWQWREAVVARSNLQTSLDAEARQRRAHERSLYANAISQAAMTWDRGEMAKAREYLTQAIPQPGQDDLRGWEWHYLDRLFHAERRIVPCDQWCNAIVRVSDAPTFAAALGNPRMNVYETGSGEGRAAFLEWRPYALKSLAVQGRAVLAVAVDPTSGTIAWGTRDQCVVLTDQSGILLMEWRVPEEITGLGFMTGGLQIIVGDRKSTARVYQCATGQIVGEHAIWSLAPTYIDVARDQKRVLFGGGLNRAKLYSLPDWTLEGELTSGRGPVISVAINISGSLAATGSTDGTLVLWNLPDRTERIRIKAHAGPVAAMVFHPSEPLIATASSNGEILIWHIPSGRLLRTFRGHQAGVRSLDFSADGQTLLSGGQDSTIRVWDAWRNPRGRLIPFHPRLNAIGLEVEKDSFTIHAANLDGGVSSWKVTEQIDTPRKEVRVPLIGRRDYPINYIAFLRQPRVVAGIPRDDPHRLAFWDRPSGTETARLDTGGEVQTLATDAGQRWIVSGSRIKPSECRIQIREGALASVSEFTLAEPGLRSVAVNATGDTAAAVGSGSVDGDLRTIWLLRSGQPPKPIGSASRHFGGLAFSPDGSLLAIGTDSRIDLYDATSGQRLRTSATTGNSTCLAFSPNGDRIASVGYDGIDSLVETGTGLVVFQLHSLAPGRPEDIAADARVVFTPDGQTLISTNWDGSINLWFSAQAER